MDNLRGRENQSEQEVSMAQNIVCVGIDVDGIPPAISSFRKVPMRISMRLIIAPHQNLTAGFPWTNPTQRFITVCNYYRKHG